MSADVLTQRVTTALAQHVGPALDMDGTRLEVLEVADGVARIRLNGVCGNCPSSIMLVVNGIEEELRKHVIEDLRESIKLDDQQVAKLNDIYDQTREKSDQVRKKLNAEMRTVWDNQTNEIRAMLRPDQVKLYDDWHEKREQERKAHGKQREGPPPPGDHR